MDNKDIFNKDGYCIVKSAISNELRDFVTQYALFDEMQDFFPEGTILTPDAIGVPAAHSKYCDPAMESMFLILQSVVEKNTGLTLYPTYSYFRVYRKGDSLKKHTDRKACEISSTICFNYSYDDNTYNWPIFIDNNPVTLSPGDLAIYKGCDLYHWREEFTPPDEDDWQVQAFFHFVDANGPYAEWKYDKRNSIGDVENPLAVKQ